MAPKRKLGRHSFFDAPALLAFLEKGLGVGKADTAERHRRTIQAAAVAAADRGLRGVDLSSIPNLPGFAREGLCNEFALFTSTVESVQVSIDGTSKFVIKLVDGHRIESVLMRHDNGRNTLCVSSQIGCKMGCTFCATGTLGELGNLTSGEILEQLAHARGFVVAGEMEKRKKDTKDHVAKKTQHDAVPVGVSAAHTINTVARPTAVTNVVFMGMGEPLNNFHAVISCIGPMSDARVFAVAKSRITVSTVGVVPKMIQLTTEFPEVRLALSLHAPNQTLREAIVPTATAYPLAKIMGALDFYLQAGSRSRTRAMIEYCVLGGVNDTTELAVELGQLLLGKDVIINLIPFNPTDTPMGHMPPTPEAVQAMQVVLAQPPFNHRTTVRKEMGQDIAGACGQLALRAGASGGFSTNAANAGDVEDIAGSGFGVRKVPLSGKGSVVPGKGSVVSGKGSVVSARAAASTSVASTSVQTGDETQTRTPTQTQTQTKTKTKTKTPQSVVFAVAALNATAAAAFAALAFATAWKAGAYLGWFEETTHKEL